MLFEKLINQELKTYNIFICIANLFLLANKIKGEYLLVS